MNSGGKRETRADALNQTAPGQTNHFAWAAVIVLLGGVFLRLASLDTMSTMLNWDEAWDSADALSLLTHPRLRGQ